MSGSVLAEEKAMTGEGHILGFGGTDYVQFLGLGDCSWAFAINHSLNGANVWFDLRQQLFFPVRGHLHT